MARTKKPQPLWYSTLVFNRREKYPSPSAVASEIGRINPPAPCPGLMEGTHRSLQQWMHQMIRTSGSLISQWIKQGIVVCVGKPADPFGHSTSSPLQAVIPLEAVLSRMSSPLSVLDLNAGYILHQAGGQTLLLNDKAMGGHYVPRRCMYMLDLHKEYTDKPLSLHWTVGCEVWESMVFRAAVECVANVVAGAISRQKTVESWGGWRGFYDEALGQTIDTHTESLSEQIHDEDVHPLIRLATLFADRLHGAHIELKSTSAVELEQVLDRSIRDNMLKRWHSRMIIDKAAAMVEQWLNILQDTWAPAKPLLTWAPNTKQCLGNVYGAYPMTMPEPEGQGGEQGEGEGESQDSESEEQDNDSKDGEQGEDGEAYRKRLRDHALQSANTYLDKSDAMVDLTSKGAPRKPWTFVPQYMDRRNERLSDWAQRYQDEIVRNSAPIQRCLGNLLVSVLKPPRPQPGYRSGDIDESALHSAGYDDRLFTRVPPEGQDKVDIMILVDASGSMSGDRMPAALTLAYGLTRVLAQSPRINTRIISHAAFRGGVQKVAVRMVETSAERLPNIVANGENADGHAIRIAADMMSKSTARRKIMVLLADGQPSVGYAYQGDHATKHVAEIVQSLPAKGIEFTCFGLDKCIPDSLGRFMYGTRFIQVPAKGEEMPRMFGRFIRESLAV